MSTSPQDMSNIISGAQGTVSGMQQGNNLGYLRALLGAGKLTSGVLGQPGGALGSTLGDVGAGLGVAQGVASGSPLGYGNAALNAGRLANNLGAFGDNSGAATSGLSGAAGALGLAGGLERGGVAGDAQAALGAGQLASSAGAAMGSSAAAAAGQYIPVVGTLLSAYLSTQTPAVELGGNYWDNYTKTLQNDINSGNRGQFAADTQGLMSSDNKNGIPANIQQMIADSGIDYFNPTPQQEQQGQQLLQQLGPHQTGNFNKDKLYSTGGNVNHYTLHDILQGPTMHQRAEAGPHMAGGGYYSYYNSYPGANQSTEFGNWTPQLQDFGAPGTGASDLSNPNSSLSQSGLVPDEPYVNKNNDPYAYNSATSGTLASQQGQGGGLGSLLSNPALLGALLGGGLGLAGALGSSNGASNMTANYKPTPPPMFQGSGPNPAGNMYGSVSATPRQSLNPTNINYATAGQSPTPGGNQFYSSSAGAPTAPQSNTSPLQQYGAQMPAPATPNAATGGISPTTLQQLIAALGGQSSTATQGLGTMPRPTLQAHGGPIDDSPAMSHLGRHLVSATHGGPNYVQGAGDGTSDDIDAKLSDGEYVMTAQDVALLGNGSNKAGAQKLDELRKRLRMDAGKKLVKGEQFMKAKANPMAYANGGTQ